MATRPYIFRIAETVKVVDGDSYWFQLHIGFRNTLLVNIRLSGYDCPERTRGSAHEKAEAARATSVTTEFLSPVVPIPESSLWVRCQKDPDNFGRWLGDIWRESDGDQWPERHLGAELRSHGLASIWPTRWRSEFDKEAG